MVNNGREALSSAFIVEFFEALMKRGDAQLSDMLSLVARLEAQEKFREAQAEKRSHEALELFIKMRQALGEMERATRDWSQISDRRFKDLESKLKGFTELSTQVSQLKNEFRLLDQRMEEALARICDLRHEK